MIFHNYKFPFTLENNDNANLNKCAMCVVIKVFTLVDKSSGMGCMDVNESVYNSHGDIIVVAQSQQDIKGQETTGICKERR